MNPSLEVGPILRSLRHHKGAFSLLVLEVALGFVMLTHTMIAVRYYFRLHVRPTGMPEDELVVARRRFLHPRDVEAARSAARADIAALARLAPAAAIETVPLPEAVAFPVALTRPPLGDGRPNFAWPVRATPAVTAALGVQVVAGTDLEAAMRTRLPDGATPILLSWSIAEALFGTIDNAIGQAVDGSGFGHARVAGVVRDFAFRSAWVPSPMAMVIVPTEPVTEHEIVYVMHAPAGARAAVVDGATRALTAMADADSAIVVKPLDRSATRFAGLSAGAMMVLAWTGFLVVAVALAGSLALASFSVAERTRQIGVRRALGASRGEIVRYFLLENFVLTAFGLGLGLGLAIGLNQVLRRIMLEMKLTPDEALLSMAVFLVTGLLSALVPARRAALIPPWAATRTL
jgi:putative ABC transport system permease protein